ncbi:MAG: phosphoribosyl 1,2-cyclic phosphate phosphodiesterase [Flavobacteriales bacterium]|jgi:phosphoribosyl 1,2-cyclic phosphate phosphodiesterase
MKITFLGTGTSQGIPVIGCQCAVCKSDNPKDDRLRTSVLCSFNNKQLVIDTGPDFRQQMLRADVQELHAVLFTHEHKDHVAGLDDVRAFNFKQKIDMPLYASEKVECQLRQEFFYAFANVKYPGVPRLTFNRLENEPFQLFDKTITPIEVMHYKLPVFGFRIDDFTYITDASYISDEEKEKIKGSAVLVINALRNEEHISHFNLEQALELIEELKPQKAYLTHISHYLGKHDDVVAKLPSHVSIAYDGLTITI